MHIVNMKAIHPNLTAALDDPTGLAVLGFFIDVSLNTFFLYTQAFFVCLFFQSNQLVLSPAGSLCRQCALWTHIPEVVLCRLQRLEDTNERLFLHAGAVLGLGMGGLSGTVGGLSLCTLLHNVHDAVVKLVDRKCRPHPHPALACHAHLPFVSVVTLFPPCAVHFPPRSNY